MTKKDFIALADILKENDLFGWDHINALAFFCEEQSSKFNRERWLNYVAGTHGPNGGKL